MANEAEMICAGCGKPITGCSYASMGGNIVPYVPAKLYHVMCVPSVKPQYTSRAVGADDYDFQLCEVCMSCDPKPATFVVNRDGVNHYYCEEHGTALNLSRGIPMNHAEPESRCKDCQAPLETGTVCADCVLRDNARLIKGFAEDPAVVEMLAKEGFKLDFDEINRLLDKSGLMPYSPKAAPKAFSYVPKRFSVEWFKSHVDHFIISFMVGVPLLVANAIASNVFTHHAVQILRALRIPATIMHWIGY